MEMLIMIVFLENGLWKLADFGLQTSVTSDAISFSRKSKMDRYRAPEVLYQSLDCCDPKADI
jgi:hypothetical protein